MDELIPNCWNERSVQHCCDGRYATAQCADNDANGVLLAREGDGWRPVGFYLDRTIYVTPGHRGTGAPEELMLRCLELRNDQEPGDWQLTPKGYSLLRRVHRLSVEKAMAAGQKVRDAVLEDYPELRSIIEPTGSSATPE